MTSNDCNCGAQNGPNHRPHKANCSIWDAQAERIEMAEIARFELESGKLDRDLERMFADDRLIHCE